MEDIKEDYVSFETAKLLKQRGYFIDTKNDEFKIEFWKENGHIVSINREWWDRELHKNYIKEDYCLIPTQALVLKWLRVKHNIIITPLYWNDEKAYTLDIYHNDAWMQGDGVEYPSYEEATEAGIKCCIKHLVK